MDVGIIAAVVILSVELVIIIVVLIYLFSRRRPQAKSVLTESGQYNDDSLKSTKKNGKLTEIEVEKETEVIKENEEIIQDTAPESESFPVRERGPGLTSSDETTNEKGVESSSSSSDEGVSDVEKPESSTHDSSSSSSEDENHSDEEIEKQEEENVKENRMGVEEEKASSSSSDESEKEDVTTSDVQEVTPQQHVIQKDSSHNNLNSLESGVTLSLRLNQSNGYVEKKSSSSSPYSSSSSSSSASSSEDESGVKVIRTYDRPNDPDRDISIIYDPLGHKVVNVDDLRTDFKESSFSSASDDDEPIPVEEDEVVAGIINVTSGEKLTISKAVSKGLIPEKTGMLLLEAQAATGSVVNPRTGVKLSVEDAVKQGVIDARYKNTLAASEGAYYGYLDPRKHESVPLFEAMNRGIFPRAQGMRLLEAQVATGGIVDPWTGKRYNLSGALSKGLIDRDTAKILKNPDDHADFFDPNTRQRFNYGNLLSKCIRDRNTGLKFLYLEEKPMTNVAQYQPDLLTFRSAFRRKVSLQDLISAGVVSKKVLDQFNRGQLTKDDLYEKLKPYLVGDPPIAGIYNRTSHEVLTICQAVRSGLLRRGTAQELLEAQAATGNIIDPKTGKQMSVNRAISIGLVDNYFASILRKAELSVLGYQSDKNGTISLFEAMKKGTVIEVHGIRLLDAQIATGGLIDPVGGYRIPTAIAMKRGILDQRLADTLANPSLDQKGYYDPNTDENVTYAELLRRTVVDKKKHVGMRLLPLSDKTPNLRIVSKGPTKSRKIIIMNPKTRQPMSLKQAIASDVVDIETAKRIQAQQRH